MRNLYPLLINIFYLATQPRFLTKAALFGVLATLLLYNGIVTAVDPEDSIGNTTESNGIVALEMRIEPAAVQAGDEVTLEIIATNRGAQANLISLRSILPSNVNYDTTQIPASTSFNYQQRQFTWQPVVPAGQTRRFTLPMTVTVADLTEPIQKVEANVQNGGIFERLSAEFWVGIPPTASIIAPDTIPIGRSIQLYADIQGPGPFAQEWRTTDGRTLRAANPEISFATAGEHTIELSVENPVGKTTARKTILVTPEPVADFSLDDLTPGIDQTIEFLSLSGGATPMQYRWDFGDGTTSTDRNPTHQYPEIGTYEVTLTVENAFGIEESTIAVKVGEPPSANMVLPSRAKVGERLLGKAFGDATVTQFEWEMGNGQRASGGDLDYMYTQSGTYTVALIARNPFGVTQLEQQVEVEAGILSTFLPIISNLFTSPTAATEAEVEQFANFTPIDLERDVAPLDSSQERKHSRCRPCPSPISTYMRKRYQGSSRLAGLEVPLKICDSAFRTLHHTRSS